MQSLYQRLQLLQLLNHLLLTKAMAVTKASVGSVVTMDMAASVRYNMILTMTLTVTSMVSTRLAL